MRPFVPASALLVATLCGARGAMAASAGCSLGVEAAPALDTRWPGLAEDVRQAFGERDDVDACARVVLSATGNAIGIQVTLADGRRAERSVLRAEDVVPMLEALLLMPRDSAPMSELAPSADARSSSDDRAPTDRGGAASRLGIELCLATGVRVGDNQASLGAGALSFLDFSGWLAGFEGRLAHYSAGPSASDPPHELVALELGALAGRRFPLGSVALDLMAGPALSLSGGSRSTTVAVNPSPSSTPQTITQSQSTRATVPRFVAEAHLAFNARGVLRPFVGIDSEFGPTGVSGPTGSTSAGSLPTWELGVALGASLGTR